MGIEAVYGINQQDKETTNLISLKERLFGGCLLIIQSKLSPPLRHGIRCRIKGNFQFFSE